MEKDERFWAVTAFMSLYHADDGRWRPFSSGPSGSLATYRPDRDGAGMAVNVVNG